MIELLAEAVPPGVLNVVAGGDEIGAAMSQHPKIQKMVFTGSAATGRKVMASAAPTLKHLTLELGGNDAGIVLPDADIDALIAPMFWGAFINSGQTCAALEAPVRARLALRSRLQGVHRFCPRDTDG